MARATIAPLIPAILAACGPGVQSLSGEAFGTTWSVKYVGELALDEAERLVTRELEEFDRIFSTYRPDSEISRFNDYASYETFACSDDLRRVVQLAQELAQRTRGAFDPTVKPLRDLYDSWSEGGAEPDPELLQKTRQRVGWGKLLVTDVGLKKAFLDLELDLNAIAKGAGVDRIGEALAAHGIESFFVEIGGEVLCRGSKPGGDPWRVGIADPARPRSPRSVVELRDAALATSGTYLNHKRLGDRIWHHVFDPRTGKNADNGVVSVSVVASRCALADGLATALLVLGPEASEEVLASYADQGAGALFLLAGEGETLVEKKVRWPW